MTLALIPSKARSSGSRAIRLAQEREKASKAAAAAALSFSRAKTCVKIDDKFNKAIIDVVSNAGLHDPNGPEAKVAWARVRPKWSQHKAR